MRDARNKFKQKLNNIKYIKRKDIDLAKYDNCIAKAINSRIYGYSWYLDIVADDWNVLVLGDYKAVMPITYMRAKKNLLFKKIIQAFYTQQLGIFTQKELNNELATAFYTEFRVLNPQNYTFNDYDFQYLKEIATHLLKRTNYELNLNDTYSNLYKNYSKNIKRNIKKYLKEENTMLTTAISVSDFIDFKKVNSSYKTTVKEHKILKKLILETQKRNYGKLYGIKQNGVLIAAIFSIYDNYRLTSLVSVASNKGKEIGAISFVIDSIIKEMAASEQIFDFEGSMQPGIARFYKSFGASDNPYFAYTTPQ